MKRCPYCAEEIQDAARKCKHCGEWLDPAARPAPPPAPPPAAPAEALPWHRRTSTLVTAFAFLGPFALPLLWMRPQTSLRWKIAITAVMGVFTLLFLWVARAAGTQLQAYYDLLQSTFEGF